MMAQYSLHIAIVGLSLTNLAFAFALYRLGCRITELERRK